MADGFSFGKAHLIKPLTAFGLDGPFWTVDAEIVWHTWVALAILTILCVLGRIALRMHMHPMQSLVLTFTRQITEMFEQVLGGFYPRHIYFGAALFVFILLCNTVSIIPWVEEPTRELNTTLALSIIGFIYTEYHAVKAHGITGYLADFFQPFFFMLPLNIVGKLSTIVSLAFRLFGNIFASSVISTIYFKILGYGVLYQLIGLFSGFNLVILLFFGLFEGFIQAFIFSILTVTNVGLAIAPPDSTK